MIHPDLKEPIFAEWYGSPKLLEAVQQLLLAKHDDLQLGKRILINKYIDINIYIFFYFFTELFNLLINPQNSDFDLTWHRDAITAETSEEEEKEKLTIPHYGTQWNT